MQSDATAKPRAPYAYDFNIKQGQEVDYLGKAWIVNQLDGKSQAPGQARIIKVEGGKEKTVMVSDLRPAATPRAAKFLPGQELNIHEEDFVVFEGEESITMGRWRGENVKCMNMHAMRVGVYGYLYGEGLRPPTSWRGKEGHNYGPQPTNFMPEATQSSWWAT